MKTALRTCGLITGFLVLPGIAGGMDCGRIDFGKGAARMTALTVLCCLAFWLAEKLEARHER